MHNLGQFGRARLHWGQLSPDRRLIVAPLLPPRSTRCIPGARVNVTGCRGMIDERLARLRQTAARLFPERHLYVRSGGEMRKFVLSSKRQMVLASAGAGVAVWSLLATSGIILNAFQLSLADQAVARERARAERLAAMMRTGRTGEDPHEPR